MHRARGAAKLACYGSNCRIMITGLPLACARAHAQAREHGSLARHQAATSCHASFYQNSNASPPPLLTPKPTNKKQAFCLRRASCIIIILCHTPSLGTDLGTTKAVGTSRCVTARARTRHAPTASTWRVLCPLHAKLYSGGNPGTKRKQFVALVATNLCRFVPG